MTDQERLDAFIATMKEAEQKTGVTVVAILRVEELGNALLTKPDLDFRLISKWQPPKPET